MEGYCSRQITACTILKIDTASRERGQTIPSLDVASYKEPVWARVILY